jgi:hypothetical protein
MPENKVDPFAPQGEILGQTLTVRVDVSAPSDQRRRDGVNRTHSEASSAPRESLERQSSFGSGSDYEDARNAYIRGEECARRQVLSHSHTHTLTRNLSVVPLFLRVAMCKHSKPH